MKKDNMYEFITKRVNPLAGKCSHDCSYCYVKKMKRFPILKEKYSGEPRIDESEFKKKFKDNDFVFVCTCNDLFANNVNGNIIERILDYYGKQKGTFLFQTKNPENSLFYSFPENAILCTTIETNRFYKKIMGNTPKPVERSYYFPLSGFITIEPIMDFDLKDFITLLEVTHPNQINIGADSGNNHLPEPPKEKILELISELKKFTTVHLKSNLNRLIK